MVFNFSSISKILYEYLENTIIKKFSFLKVMSIKVELDKKKMEEPEKNCGFDQII